MRQDERGDAERRTVERASTREERRTGKELGKEQTRLAGKMENAVEQTGYEPI